VCEEKRRTAFHGDQSSSAKEKGGKVPKSDEVGPPRSGEKGIPACMEKRQIGVVLLEERGEDSKGGEDWSGKGGAGGYALENRAVYKKKISRKVGRV